MNRNNGDTGSSSVGGSSTGTGSSVFSRHGHHMHPMETTWLPLMYMFVARYPTVLTVISMVVDFFQCLAFALNPHNPGHYLTWSIIYCFQIPFWDESFNTFIPYSTFTILYFILVAVLWINVLIFALSFRYAQFIIANVMGVFRHVTNFLLSIFFIPSIQALLSMFVCEVNPRLSSQERNALNVNVSAYEEHILFFDDQSCGTTMANVGMGFSIATLIAWGAVSYMVLITSVPVDREDDSVRRRCNTYVDIFMYIYRVGLCFTFFLTQAFNCRGTGVLIVSIMSLLAAILYGFYLPYYAEWVNRLTVVVYAVISWSAMTIYIGYRVDTELYVNHNIIYVVLALGAFVSAVIAFVLSGVRYSAKTKHLFKMCGSKTFVTMPENPFAIAALQNNFDLLPFPRGLPTTDACFSPYHHVTLQVLEEGFREEAEVQAALLAGAQPGAAPQPASPMGEVAKAAAVPTRSTEQMLLEEAMRTQVVSPTIEVAWVPTDAEVASRFLVEWQSVTQTFPTPHMISFASRIFNRFMLLYPRRGILIVAYLSFLCDYANNFSRMNMCLDIIRSAICELDLSLTERFLLYYFSLHVKEALGIRNAIHQVIVSRARSMHQDVLLRTTLVWRNLLEENRASMSLYWFTNSLALSRYECFCTYVNSLNTVTDDEVFLRNAGLFMDGVYGFRHSGTLCQAVAETVSSIKMMRLQRTFQESARVAEVMDMVNAETEADAKVAAAVEEEHKQDEGNDVASLDQAASSRMSSSLASSSTRVSSVLTSEGRSSQSKVRNSKKITAQMVERIQASVSKSYEELCAHLHWDMFKVSSIFAVILMLAVVAANFAVILVRLAAWRRLEAIIRSINYCRGFINMMLAQMYRTTALLPLDSSVGLSKTQQANLLTNVTYFRSIIDAAEAAHNDVLFGNNRIQDGKLHARVTRISNFVRFYTSDDDYTESRVSYLTHIPVVLASARRIAATLETTPGYFEFLGTIDPNMMSKNILITVESTFSELSTFMETNIRSFSSMSIIIFCACIAGTLFLMCAVGYLLLWNYRRAASVIAKELTLFNIIPKESVKRLAAEAQQKLDTFTYLNERQNVVTAVVESFEEEQKQPISMTDMMLAFGPKTAAGPTDGAAATAAPTGAAAAPSSKLLSHIIQHGGVDVKEASSPSNRRASTSAVLSHKSPRTTPVPGATSPLEDVGSALSGPQGSGEPPAEPTLRSDDGEEGMEMSSRQPTLEYATPGVPEGSPMLPSLSSPPVMGEGSSHSEPEDSLTPPTEQTDELDDVDEGDYTDFGDKLLNVYRLSGVSDEKKRLTRRQRMSMLGTITAIPPGGYDDDGLLEMDGDGDGFLDDEDASDREGSVDSEDRTGGSPHKSGRGAAAAHRASQKLPSSICLALLPLVLTTCMIIAAFAVNAAAVYSANDISDSTTSATAGLDCAWQIGNTTFSFYFYAARFVASQSFSDYLNVRDTIITNGEVLDNCRSAINSTNFFEAQRLIVTISLVSMSLIAHNIVENMTGSQAAATSAFALVANETWTPLPMTAQLANSLEPYLTAQQLSEWAPYTNSTYDLALPVEERHELALQTFLGPFGLALLENMVNGYTELLTDLQGVLDDSVSSSYNSFKSMEVATLALLGVSILSCFLVIGVYRHHRRVVILSLVCISLLVVSMITGILSLTKAQTFRSQELDWSQSYNTLYSQLCQFPRTVAYAVSYPFIDNDNALLQLLDVTSAEYIISVDNAFLPQPSSINKNVYLSTFRNVLSSRNEFIHYAWMSIVCAVHGRGDVSIFATNPQISDVTWNMNMDEFYYNYRKMNPNEVYFTTFEDDITNSNPEAMMNLSQKTITSSLLSTLGVQAFGSQSVASGQLTQEYDAALEATQNQMLRLHWVSFGFCIAALIVFFGIVVILSLGSIRAFSRTRDERVIYSAAFGKDSNHVLLTIASVVVFVVVANLVCIGFSAKLTSVLHVEQRVLQEQWFLSNTVALCLSLSNWTTYYDYSVTRGRLVTMLDSIVTMHQDAYLTSQAAMGMRGNRNTILFGSTTPYANYDSTSASMLKVSSCTDPTNSVDGNQQPFLIQFGVIYDLIRGIVLLPKSVTIQPLVLKAALLDIMTRVGSLQYHFYSDPTKATAYVTKELNTCLAVALVMLILAALVSILSFFCCLNSITTKVTQQSIGSKLLLLGLPDDILNTVPEIKEFYDPEAGSSNDQLKRKLQQSERLLQNILPPSISRRLKNGERVIADSHLSVTAVFASLVGFDEYAHKFDAKQLVLFLNGLVVAFDHIVDLLDLEKVKTIGDIYFFCGGLTKKTERDHALRCMECSLFFFEALEDHNNRHNTPNMKLRVGMNTDPAVAGVIGNKKVAYDLWGDCVNTASRMYSTGVPGRIQVSDNTYAKISSYFHFEDCHVQAKGKGTLLTHLYVDRVKSTVYTDINWRVST